MRTGMRAHLRPIAVCTVLMISAMASACKTGGGSVSGNENGSEPINDAESVEYKKAVVRCYKTGGTRIVKIMGDLRCY